MGIPVRISQEIYEAAKKIAKAEYRSIPNQIEYWAQIGRCVLEHPDLPVAFIQDILASRNTDESLAEPFEPEGDNG